MPKDFYILVNTKVLPPVFKSVIIAKELLSSGKSANISNAVKSAGISRSAFYKYKDCVFKYEADDKQVITLNAVLYDRAGVLSQLTTALYSCGANILTVNQRAPRDGKAAVSLTVKTDNSRTTVDDLIEHIKSVNGIVSIKEA